MKKENKIKNISYKLRKQKQNCQKVNWKSRKNTQILKNFEKQR